MLSVTFLQACCTSAAPDRRPPICYPQDRAVRVAQGAFSRPLEPPDGEGDKDRSEDKMQDVNELHGVYGGVEGVQTVCPVAKTRQPTKSAPEGAQRRRIEAGQNQTASIRTVSSLDRASAAHLRAAARDAQ